MPQSKRVLKARLKMLILMISMFFVTLVVCLVTFIFLDKIHGVVSPLQLAKQHIATLDVQTQAIKQWCKDTNTQCVDVATDSDAITITLGNNIKVILSRGKDIKKQLASLQQAIPQLTIKGRQFKTLDFRFENSVATF